MPVEIRLATAADHDAIAALLIEAFGGAAEAALVARLRSGGDAVAELVATSGGEVAGHILFSRLRVVREDGGDIRAVALAPVAVDPARQGTGIGSMLIREGLDRCRAAGEALCLVLGHPGYYPRFGFSSRLAQQLESAYSGAGAAFMALNIVPGVVRAERASVRYPPAFDEL